MRPGSQEDSLIESFIRLQPVSISIDIIEMGLMSAHYGVTQGNLCPIGLKAPCRHVGSKYVTMHDCLITELAKARTS